MTRPSPGFAPRLLPSPEAAHYLGVSESTLRGLGIPRTLLGGKKLYDRLALEAYASGLPVEGEDDAGANTCDAVFGTTTGPAGAPATGPGR